MLVLVNVVEKNEFLSNKFKNIKKSGNKIVKILAKSRSENLSKFKNFIKIQIISIKKNLIF